MQAHMCKAKKAKRRGGDKRRDSQAYWEQRLRACGLGMEAGHIDWITYGHTFGDRGLDWDGEKVYGAKTKRGESGVRSEEKAGEASRR